MHNVLLRLPWVTYNVNIKFTFNIVLLFYITGFSGKVPYTYYTTYLSTGFK